MIQSSTCITSVLESIGTSNAWKLTKIIYISCCNIIQQIPLQGLFPCLNNTVHIRHGSITRHFCAGIIGRNTRYGRMAILPRQSVPCRKALSSIISRRRDSGKTDPKGSLLLYKIFVNYPDLLRRSRSFLLQPPPLI